MRLKLNDLNKKQFRIWSGEHMMWWRPGRSGYTTGLDQAGIYTFAEAWAATKHCGPEKQIQYIEVRDAGPA